MNPMNEKLDEIHREASIVAALIETIFERVTGEANPDRDYALDALLDAANQAAQRLPALVEQGWDIAARMQREAAE